MGLAALQASNLPPVAQAGPSVTASSCRAQVCSKSARASLRPVQTQSLPQPNSAAFAGGALLGPKALALLGICVLARARRGLKGESRAKPRSHVARFGYGPTSTDKVKMQELLQDTSDIGRRVAAVVDENRDALENQLRQYYFTQIDGLLGDSKLTKIIRDELKLLFDRGWFAEETEKEGEFKIGEYVLSNNDKENRFKAKFRSYKQAKDEADTEKQYDVAPNVVQFIRSLSTVVAKSLSRAAGTQLSMTHANAEMHVLCGNGSRIDRRVSNFYGWNTKQGFQRDSRKLIMCYFSNPNWENNGGALQLEGVVTPAGQLSMPAEDDRLALFWADKVVWSFSALQAQMITSHFEYIIMAELMVEDNDGIQYNPMDFARWFPELREEPMDWPPKPASLVD